MMAKTNQPLIYKLGVEELLPGLDLNSSASCCPDRVKPDRNPQIHRIDHCIIVLDRAAAKPWRHKTLPPATQG